MFTMTVKDTAVKLTAVKYTAVKYTAIKYTALNHVIQFQHPPFFPIIHSSYVHEWLKNEKKKTSHFQLFTS